MRRLLIAAAMSLSLPAATALAQTADDATPPAPKVHKHRTHHRATATSGERPIDVGPNTPEANGAYMGGGVILQGAPGAPAPRPQATPPGQVPANSVPQ